MQRSMAISLLLRGNEIKVIFRNKETEPKVGILKMTLSLGYM